MIRHLTRKTPKKNQALAKFYLDPDLSPLYPLSLLAMVYLGALVFSAFVSPWVYHLVLKAESLWGGPLLEYLALKIYPDYFDRLRWLPVVILLPMLYRWLGFGKSTYMGWYASDFLKTLFWIPFILGILTLAIPAGTQLVFLDWNFKENAFWPLIALKAISGAIILGILEETVFRGLILRIFNHATGVIAGTLLSSFFFASTHFKMADETWLSLQDQSVNWVAGLKIAGLTLIAPFAHWEMIPFLSLFMAGICLCLLYYLTGRLAAPIGLHAGWVALRQNYTSMVASEDTHAILGSPKLTNSLLAVAVMGLFAVILVIILLRKNRVSTPDFPE